MHFEMRDKAPLSNCVSKPLFFFPSRLIQSRATCAHSATEFAPLRFPRCDIEADESRRVTPRDLLGDRVCNGFTVIWGSLGLPAHFVFSRWEGFASSCDVCDLAASERDLRAWLKALVANKRRWSEERALGSSQRIWTGAVVVVLSRLTGRIFLDDAFREDVFGGFREPLLEVSPFGDSTESSRSLRRLITVAAEQDDSEDSGCKTSPRSGCFVMFSVTLAVKWRVDVTIMGYEVDITELSKRKEPKIAIRSWINSWFI
jgi:hypothetical protein